MFPVVALSLCQAGVAHNAGGVPLDKSEGVVKTQSSLCGFARLGCQSVEGF